jgi:hypothetical protein
MPRKARPNARTRQSRKARAQEQQEKDTKIEAKVKAEVDECHKDILALCPPIMQSDGAHCHSCPGCLSKPPKPIKERPWWWFDAPWSTKANAEGKQLEKDRVEGWYRRLSPQSDGHCRVHVSERMHSHTKHGRWLSEDAAECANCDRILSFDTYMDKGCPFCGYFE